MKYIPNLRAANNPIKLGEKKNDPLDFINNKSDYIRLVGIFALKDI